MASPNPAATSVHADLERALQINPSDRQALRLSIAQAALETNVSAEIPLLTTALELTPAEATLWSRLGDLQFAQKDFPAAETALLRARELGASGARWSEELGRIRLAKQDLPRALGYFLESLKLDPSQQALWFLAADLAKETGKTGDRIEALERGLGLGGNQLPRRIELIRVYFDNGDPVNAARHADIERPRLPADAETQTIWARFYEKLSRQDDAFSCWQRVVEADPKNEPGHHAIASVLLSRKLYPDALAAAERGLEADPQSARLEVVKADALRSLDRVYDLRRSLERFKPGTPDPEFLRRAAEAADAYGGPAPAAYRRYAESLLQKPDEIAELKRVRERGARVAAREGDEAAFDWFERELPHLMNPGSLSMARQAAPGEEAGVWIPGGVEALAYIVGSQPGTPADRFLISFCRAVIAHSTTPLATAQFQKEVAAYFKDLNQLLSFSTRSGDRAVITLSVANKPAQARTDAVLAVLGWRQRRVNREITITFGEKHEQAKHQDIASALAVDQGGMQNAFREGKPFRLEIPSDRVPLLFDETTWRTAFRTDKYGAGLVEALSQNPAWARIYLGLSNVDRPTGAVLLRNFGLTPRYADLLASYSSSLAIEGGRAAVPGGSAAESIWASLVGAGPADPADFFRRLLEKDDGKMLAWFFLMSELDPAHQRFFTHSLQRTRAFYTAFTQSDELRAGAGKLVQGASFGEFMRAVPLRDGAVNFPGSAEVWVVSNGRSMAAGQSGKLLRKLRRAVAPEIEDEILLRLAKTRTKIEEESLSETAAFLAVAAIDARRTDPLDEESALWLAQNYQEFRNYYPCFSDLRTLTADDFRSFFAFLQKVRQGTDYQTETALGQFNALLEWIRLGIRSGGLKDEKAAAIFRSVCAAFGNAADLAGYTAATFDAVRQLLGSGDPDRSAAMLTMGTVAPFETDPDGETAVWDPGHRRAVAYARVLNLQKIPEFAPLLRIDEAVRRIAGGKEPAGPLIAGLSKDAAALPSVDIPKGVKFQGIAKTIVERFNPAKTRQLIADLQQKSLKKKVNPKEIPAVCREILEELAPQIRLALTGAIYALHFSPDNILVGNDPLLVRKHRAFLSAGTHHDTHFPEARLETSSAGEGSFFVGGFAAFSKAAVLAESASGAGVNGMLYVSQMGWIRSTPWGLYGEADQRLLGFRIRMAREWCVYAADDPALLKALAEDALGILSLNRRRALLQGIAARRWAAIRENPTLSDLLFLSDRYLARYPEAPWPSPADAALRHTLALTDGSGLAYLRPEGAPTAPYEEFEHHLFPAEMADRAAEMNLYLAAALDRSTMPAAALPALAEIVAKRIFRSMRMSDERDWNGALAAFAAIDEKTIRGALEELK